MTGITLGELMGQLQEQAAIYGEDMPMLARDVLGAVGPGTSIRFLPGNRISKEIGHKGALLIEHGEGVEKDG